MFMVFSLKKFFMINQNDNINSNEKFIAMPNKWHILKYDQ